MQALGVDSYAAKAPMSMSKALEQALKEHAEACDVMEGKLVCYKIDPCRLSLS